MHRPSLWTPIPLNYDILFIINGGTNMDKCTHFTQEQIDILKVNPYTAFVDETTLKFTLAFKKYALKESEAGKKAREIFTKAGYDARIIGKVRLSNAMRNIRNQAKSAKGLRPPACERRANELREKEATIKALNSRVNMLEDELFLLKKSINLRLTHLKDD